MRFVYVLSGAGIQYIVIVMLSLVTLGRRSMGITIEINSLEEMCMLMCDNQIPEKEPEKEKEKEEE